MNATDSPVREFSSFESLPPEQQGLVMAFSIMIDRLVRLSREDSHLVAQLLKDFLEGDTAEDRQAAKEAIFEVLVDSPVEVRSLPQEEEQQKRPEALRKWVQWVAQRIREERTRAGLTQEQLSEKTGLPQSHISRIENQRHSPSRTTIEKIAAALGLSTEAFDPS